MSNPNDLLSIGAIAAKTGRPVNYCLSRLDALGRSPRVNLNGVAYFDRGDADLILPNESPARGRQQFVDSGRQAVTDAVNGVRIY